MALNSWKPKTPQNQKHPKSHPKYQPKNGLLQNLNQLDEHSRYHHMTLKKMVCFKRQCARFCRGNRWDYIFAACFNTIPQAPFPAFRGSTGSSMWTSSSCLFSTWLASTGTCRSSMVSSSPSGLGESPNTSASSPSGHSPSSWTGWIGNHDDEIWISLQDSALLLLKLPCFFFFNGNAKGA